MELALFAHLDQLQLLMDQDAQAAKSMKNSSMEDVPAKKDTHTIVLEFVLSALTYQMVSSSMEFAQFVPTTWSTMEITDADVLQEKFLKELYV